MPSFAGRRLAITVEHRNQALEEPGQLRSPDLQREDPPGVLRVPEQVLLTPELPRNLKALSVAEQESHDVVDRRPPAIEDTKPSAQRVIFLLITGTCDQAPVSSGRGQPGKGQRLAMPGAQPGGSLRYTPAELPDKGHVVITGQPLARCPQVDPAKRRTIPVAHCEPAFVAKENRHPGIVAEPSTDHKRDLQLTPVGLRTSLRQLG